MTVRHPRGLAAADELLRYLSELGSGTYAQARAACGELGLSTWKALCVLSDLGHVEFSREAGRWAVCPPALATVATLPGVYQLTGQRRSGLLDSLARRIDESELDIALPADGTAQPGAPASVYLHGEADAAQALADSCGLAFLTDPYTLIARAAPHADLDQVGEVRVPDERQPHWPLDPHSFAPQQDTGGSGHYSDGLWAWASFTDPHGRYLREGGTFHYLPDPAWGPYLVRRPEDAEGLVRYEPAHRLLVVSGIAPLPMLQRRAATLCSGRMPVRQSLSPSDYELHYLGVDDETAASVLGHLTRARI